MTGRLTSYDDLMAELSAEERAKIEREVAAEVAAIRLQRWVEEFSEHISAVLEAVEGSPVTATVTVSVPGGRAIEIRGRVDITQIRRQLEQLTRAA